MLETNPSRRSSAPSPTSPSSPSGPTRQSRSKGEPKARPSAPARSGRGWLNRPGRTGIVAFLLSAVGVAGVGLLVLQTFAAPTPGTALDAVGAVAGKEQKAKATLPTAKPSSNPVVQPSSAAGAPKALGTVKGVYTLRGPASAAPGSWAMFVLTGPKRVVRSDGSAPFATRVNTQAIPNGNYTLTVVVMRAGTPATVDTYTLKVLNSKKKQMKAPTTPSAAPSPSAGTGTSVDPGSSFAAQVIDLTNAERVKNKCPALTVDAELTGAAQAHSADMATSNYFSHDSQDGRSPFDRMKTAGYNYTMAAENIAMGQRTAQDVVTAWMNSAGHRANILNCGLTQIGVGYALNPSGTPYWTQDFGTPAS